MQDRRVVAVVQSPRFTEKDYLALEGVAESKHEYCAGDIIAIAGAEPEHNLIAENVKAELRALLRGRPRRIYGSDQRVKTEATREYYYPDAVITCLDPIYQEPHPRSLVNPQVIVEVLSAITEQRDRGEKWIAYQSIPTLTEYLMIAGDRRRVEQYRRGEDGGWTYSMFTEGSVPVFGAIVEVDAIYALTSI